VFARLPGRAIRAMVRLDAESVGGASSPFCLSSSISGRAITVRSSTRGSNDDRLEDFLAADLRDSAPSDRSGMSWRDELGVRIRNPSRGAPGFAIMRRRPSRGNC